MASIRRATSSPAAAAAANNQHQSQISSFLPTSSSLTPPPPPTATTIIISSPSRKWASHHHHHHSFFFFFKWLNNLRKKMNKTRSFTLRIFLFFLLGCFLGFSPFPHLCLHDLKPHHFFFDSAPTINLHNNNIISQQQLPTPIPKLLIIVTPTYNRALQAYYLTRLAHTLRLVPPPLLWIVIEMDDSAASHETSHILRRAGVMYMHLICDKSSNSVKDRGVHQRNIALDHIERHHLDGIVYFADDDNVYSLQLFHHLRNIRKFGTWPVAMLEQNKNKATLEGPVCNGNQVIGWHTNEKSKRLRRFHVDMSGFAFNSTILWDIRRWRHLTSHPIRQLDTVKEGFQETTFMEQVVEDESEMESVPHDCSRIMNWHLHLEAKHLVYPKAWKVSRNLDVSSLGEDQQF